MSDEAAIISPMPSEIIANTVPARLVEKLPNSKPKNKPASPPASGVSGSGIKNPAPPASWMRCIAK